MLADRLATPAAAGQPSDVDATQIDVGDLHAMHQQRGLMAEHRAATQPVVDRLRRPDMPPDRTLPGRQITLLRIKSRVSAATQTGPSPLPDPRPDLHVGVPGFDRVASVEPSTPAGGCSS